MDAFATVSDLEARWRTLTADEQVRADPLLKDAAIILLSEMNRCGVGLDITSEVQHSALVMVSCNMVKRVLANGTGADVSSMQTTAGSYSEQRTFANPAGDMYITKAERRLLRIPSRYMHIGSLRPKRHKRGDEHERPECDYHF